MESEDLWNTRREKIIERVIHVSTAVNLRDLFVEMQYSNKSDLVNDIKSIAKSLKSQNRVLLYLPASCIACGYQFSQDKDDLKIPSKCPKCKNQRIDWPSIKIK